MVKKLKWTDQQFLHRRLVQFILSIELLLPMDFPKYGQGTIRDRSKLLMINQQLPE